jgi:branched-chain amino acid transport system substrate-binding protein
MKKFLVITLVITVAVGLTALSVCPAAAKKKGPIKIGAVLNFTGPIAFIGPIFKRGIVQALEEVKYTINGRKIVLIIEDAASSPAKCVEKVKKLVERDKVQIIIGPLMGDAQLAIAPYLKRKKVLISTLYCGDIKLTNYPNWLIYPTTLVGLTAPVGWYAADRGWKRMVTIGSDYAGGRGFIKGIKIGFEQRGGKVVQQIWTPVGTRDYGPALSNVTRKADCSAYFVPSPTEVMRLLPQYRQFVGARLPLLATTAAADMPEEIMKQLKQNVLGLEGQALYINTRKDPVNMAFVKAMKKRWGKVPGGLESNSYCITRAILAGLKATGGDESFDKLKPAILKIKFQTPQGPLSWTRHGVAVTDCYIARATFKNGHWFWQPIKIYKAVMDPRLK